MLKKLALLALSIVVLTGCSRGDMSFEMPQVSSEKPVSIETINLKTLSDNVIVSGLTQPGETKVIKVNLDKDPELLVKLGDYVEVGQALIEGQSSSGFEIKSLEMEIKKLSGEIKQQERDYQSLVNGGKASELKRLNTELESAKFSYDQQVKKVEVNESVAKFGGISDKDLQASKLELVRLEDLYKKAVKAKTDYESTGYEIKKTTLLSQIENSKFAKSSKEDLLAKKLKDKATYAYASPIKGRVTSIYDETEGLGEIKLSDLSKLMVELDLSEKMKRHLKLGQKLILMTNDKHLEAEIVSLGLLPDEKTKGYKVTLLMDNKEGLAAGAFVKVKVALDTAQDVVAVPEKAVIKNALSAHVFVIEDQVAVKKEVTLGLKEDGYIEIKSGLNPGEVVVVTGNYSLEDGTPVTIVDTASK